MQRAELLRHLDELLQPERFRDYCPNGLQVEGRHQVRRVVTGVTASLALLEAAVALDADAVLVHHGWFWRGEDPRITGTRRARLALALRAELNLIAYHLPLDAHPVLGNNAQLAALMGWRCETRFGDQELISLGAVAPPVSAAELVRQVSARLGREALLVGDGSRSVSRPAWCTGAAQGYFEAAVAAGADCYLSGEISEHTVHLARESGVPYIAAGHHATERLGVQALGRHLIEACGLDCRFVDIANPV